MPHSPNLVPEVGRERSLDAARTREAMTELGILIGEEKKPKNCVIVSPHSPFLPEAFGVWEGTRLSGSMSRFQAPEIVVSLDMASALAEAIVDVGQRMEIPVGRLLEEWELDRGVTVPSMFLLPTDAIGVVPVAISMLGWEEHWLFGSAIAKAAQMVDGDTVIIASSNFSHRVTPDAPHGYSAAGPAFDTRVRDAVERGRLRELLDIPHDLCREASECGFTPLLVLAGAFDGRSVRGRVLSYEAPYGIGSIVADITVDDTIEEPRMASVGAEASAETELTYDDARTQFRRR